MRPQHAEGGLVGRPRPGGGVAGMLAVPHDVGRTIADGAQPGQAIEDIGVLAADGRIVTAEPVVGRARPEDPGERQDDLVEKHALEEVARNAVVAHRAQVAARRVHQPHLAIGADRRRVGLEGGDQGGDRARAELVVGSEGEDVVELAGVDHHAVEAGRDAHIRRVLHETMAVFGAPGPRHGRGAVRRGVIGDDDLERRVILGGDARQAPADEGLVVVARDAEQDGLRHGATGSAMASQVEPGGREARGQEQQPAQRRA